MTVDPKAKFTIPPGTRTKRVRVLMPTMFGRYSRYRYGDELDLPEEDWENHLKARFCEVGEEPSPDPDAVPGEEVVVAKEFNAQKKRKPRHIIGRLAETKEKDGDA